MSSDKRNSTPSDTPALWEESSIAASVERVAALRKGNPDKNFEELVDSLIRNRCLQVAGVGAATAGAAAIPGVGAVASVAVGSMVDMDSTQKVITELVVDIATIHGYQFASGELPAYLAITLGLNSPEDDSSASGFNPAVEQLIRQGGQQLARRATQRIAHKSVGRAVPVVGAATSAGSNILMTYSAAQRAKAYVKSGPDSVADLETTIRSSLGLQEMKLSDWTVESVSAAMTNLSDAAIEGFDQGAQRAGRAAGKAAGKLARFLRDATTPKS